MADPIRAKRNQYRGLNPHLHSFWQAEQKWNRFHNYHIGQLMAAMKAQLLPMGYTAEMDESLQIRRVGDDVRRPRSDVLIRDLDPQRAALPLAVTAGGQAVALEELTEEDVEHPYSAVVIYEESGDAVGWVELLSPSNKGDQRDAYTYLAKRRLLLEKGLVFVELDYLHETPPTFDRLPDYSAHQPNAHPYRIAVIDPRPEYRRAQVYLHEFGVDAPIPTVKIPLNAGDSLVFDFDAAYQKTFEEALYGYDIDYRQLPMNFDRYSPADQLRIVTRMLTIITAAQQKQDLEAAPLPLVETPPTLEAALAKLEGVL